MSAELVTYTKSETLQQEFPEFTHLEIYGTDDAPLFLAEKIKDLLELSKIWYERDFIENKDYVKIKMFYGGQLREMNAFTERGLYCAIFKSKTVLAEKFKDFVAVILKELRTKGVVTLATALHKLQLELQKQKVLNQALDNTTEDLWNQLTYSKEKESAFHSSNIIMANEIEELKQTVMDSEIQREEACNLEYTELLERFIMKPAYIYVTDLVEDELEMEIPDGEVHQLRISAKKLARGTYLDSLQMINCQKQITAMGSDHSCSLDDLRQLAKDSNLRYLKTHAL